MLSQETPLVIASRSPEHTVCHLTFGRMREICRVRFSLSCERAMAGSFASMASAVMFIKKLRRDCRSPPSDFRSHGPPVDG